MTAGRRFQSLPIVSIISVLPGCEKRGEKGVVFQDTDLYKWLEAVAYTIAWWREHLEELANGLCSLMGKL